MTVACQLREIWSSIAAYTHIQHLTSLAAARLKSGRFRHGEVDRRLERGAERQYLELLPMTGMLSVLWLQHCSINSNGQSSILKPCTRR